MKKFTPYEIKLRTDVRFGKGVEKTAGQLVAQYGGHRVLLVYGGGSIIKSGLYDTVQDSLKEAGIDVAELGGVQPNPRRSLVEKGIALAREKQVDFLLAVGGGSVIDTAKAIGLALADDSEYWDFYKKTRIPQKSVPVGCIHTIAAAGSETSCSTVLLDDVETGMKFGCNSFANQPVFALMNPELTYSVSAYQTGAGAADIYCHTFERYLIDSSCNLCDEFALGVLRTVVKYAKTAIQHPDDYEARAELMLAASYSHNGITCIGRSGNTFTAHWLEQPITALYDAAHGATLSVIMPAELEFIVNHGDDEIDRVVQLAEKVFDVKSDSGDRKAVAREGIRRFREWLSGIGMPVTFHELGVPEEDLERLAKLAPYNAKGVIEGYMVLEYPDVLEILISAK